MASITDRIRGRLGIAVTVVVVIASIAAISGLTWETMKGRTQSDKIDGAAHLAGQKLTYLKSLPELPPAPFRLEETDLSGGYNRITYIIDNSVDPTIPEGLCRVDIIVGWTDGSGVKQQANYASLLERDNDSKWPLTATDN